MNAPIPEEAIVDAVSSDPLLAAALLVHLANCKSLTARLGLLKDFAREKNLTSQKLDSLLARLIQTGLVCRTSDGVRLTVSSADTLRYAAVLRGVAYARYRQRDSNQIEITLSPPGRPSRLMEILPKQGFSWTRLYNTKDSLIELASQAERRLVIVSPFLDREGLQWISQIFDASAPKRLHRIMIVRGLDQTEADMLAGSRAWLNTKGVTVLGYAIAHDPTVRNPAIETFHAKMLLADDDKAYIGSANMTRWSRDFSMECGVILRGPAVRPVATLVEAMIQVSNPCARQDIPHV